MIEINSRPFRLAGLGMKWDGYGFKGDGAYVGFDAMMDATDQEFDMWIEEFRKSIEHSTKAVRDVFAKQQAIGFAEWVEKNAVYFKHGWLYGGDPLAILKTTEQLYSLYLTQQEK